MRERRTKYVPAKIIKSTDGLCVDIIDRPVRIYRKRRTALDGDMEEPCTGQKRTIGRKTFISTCYFEPKQVPVKYSETVIFNIGSKKKTYFESIYNEIKMNPYRWRETMVVQSSDCPLETSETLIPLQFEYIPIQAQINGDAEEEIVQNV